MVLDVKQLYRKIIDDPDVVVDNNTSKEQLAMDMATQRAVQHERNIEANNLGSPVSKLLQFLEKAPKSPEEETDDELRERLTNMSDGDLRLWGTNLQAPVDEDDLKNDRAYVVSQIFNRLRPESAGGSSPEPDADDTDDDTDHIFHPSAYSEKDEASIIRMREVDAEHGNKWSEHLQELRDKGENPTVGAVKLFRPTRVGGAAINSVNIGAAHKYFATHSNKDLKENAGKLVIPPTERVDGGSTDTWSEKVMELLVAQGGEDWQSEWADDGATIGPKVRELMDAVSTAHKQINATTLTPEEKAVREDEVLNQIYKKAAEDAGIDISSAGTPPKTQHTNKDILRQKKEKIINQMGTGKNPKTALAEEHANIDNDASLSDSDKETNKNELNSGMRAALIALGLKPDDIDEDDTEPSTEDKRVEDIIAHETRGGQKFEYRVGRIKEGENKGKYRAEMRVTREDGTPTDWDTAMQGVKSSKQAVLNNFIERYGTHASSGLENLEVFHPTLKTKRDAALQDIENKAKEEEQQKNDEEAKYTARQLHEQSVKDEMKDVEFGKSITLTPHYSGDGRPPDDIKGQTYGGLLIHNLGATRRGPNWGITHIDSRANFGGGYPSEADAKVAAYQLSKVHDFTKFGTSFDEAQKIMNNNPALAKKIVTAALQLKTDGAYSDISEFYPQEDEGSGQEGGEKEETATPAIRKIWQLKRGETTYAGGVEKIKEQGERLSRGDKQICYECAHMATKMNEDLGAKFTQGTVGVTKAGTQEQTRGGHAWVEIGDMVYDPSALQGQEDLVPKEEYYATNNPEDIQQVTAQQAEQLYKEVGPQGPYSTKEIAAVGGEEGAGGKGGEEGAGDEEYQDLSQHVEDAHTKISGYARRNARGSRKILEELEAKGIDVGDASNTLEEYENMERSDYDNAEEYSDEREGVWDNFLDDLQAIDATEVPITPVDTGGSDKGPKVEGQKTQSAVNKLVEQREREAQAKIREGRQKLEAEARARAEAKEAEETKVREAGGRFERLMDTANEATIDPAKAIVQEMLDAGGQEEVHTALQHLYRAEGDSHASWHRNISSALREHSSLEMREEVDNYPMPEGSDKGTLHQTGDKGSFMGEDTTIEHAATTTDENPIHHELHRHEDGSASVVMKDAETGRVLDRMATKYPNFEDALKEHNIRLKADKLDEHTPTTPEPESDEEPPTTEERQPTQGTLFEDRDFEGKKDGRQGNLFDQRDDEEDEDAGDGDDGDGDGDGGDRDGGDGDAEQEDDKQDDTPPITGVRGKDGQMRFRSGKPSEGGMPRARKGTTAFEGEPTEEPEDTRRGIDVAAEAEDARRKAAAKKEEERTGKEVDVELTPPERGEQANLFEEHEQEESGISTKRSLVERESGDAKKSALLDMADRNGTFEFLHNKDPYNNSSPQEARDNLAELDIDKLKDTLAKHHEPARKYIVSKQPPEEEPTKEDRNELLENLAKHKGVPNDEVFAEDHKHESNEGLKSLINKHREANFNKEENVKRAEAAKKAAFEEKAMISEASSKTQTMRELPDGTGPIQAQQRVREIMNLVHNHGAVLPEKSRLRLTELTRNAVEHGADMETAQREALERLAEPDKGWDNEWLAAAAERAEQDQAEHDEYNQHVTGTEGLADRSEAFERSGAGMMIQTDEKGNVTGSTHTAAGYDSPVEGKGDRVFDHHGGHDENGKPRMFGDSKPSKILGQTPEQQQAQQDHHEASRAGGQAAQIMQRNIEEENPHLAGTGKSETELEEERIASCRPPGPPPRAGLEWNCNTHRWCNPDTVRGIQNGLNDGDVAVMPNGLHAGTDDEHLDNPNNPSTHAAGGHKGHMNVDGTHQTGAVVVSKYGVHAATTPAGPATAKALGPLGHKATASGAMGAAVNAHQKENPNSYTNPDGSLVNNVRVKNAHTSGSHFANSGLFGSKSHFSQPKSGGIGSALNIFRRNRDKGNTQITKSIPIIKALKPKKKATSKDILFRSGRLGHDSKQTIKEQLRNAQLISELEDLVYNNRKK